MSCENTALYLHAYLDDELGVADAIRFEQHLAECAECRLVHERSLALRSALRRSDLSFPLPPALSLRVNRAIRQAAAPQSHSLRNGSRYWMALAASIVVTAGLSWLVFDNSSRSSRQELVAREVVDSHIRSLQANHLVDVPSSDRHTVKPWFQGKLDFSPPVPDLSAQGWVLVGGRLDYLDSQPVAALIYERRKHQINVLVRPTTGGAEEAIRQQTSQGYQVLHWTHSGMTYWVTSDLNPSELREFAETLKRQ
jgi:anti-sigma factor RsiW